MEVVVVVVATRIWDNWRRRRELVRSKCLETRREEVLSPTSHNKLLRYRELRRLFTWERADDVVIILGGVIRQSLRIDLRLADDGIQPAYEPSRLRGWLRREVGSICPTYKGGERLIVDIEDHEKTYCAE